MDNSNATLFQKISSSPEAMAEFLADRVVLPPCVLICGGDCSAVDGFRKTGREICKEKIVSFLNQRVIEESV